MKKIKAYVSTVRVHWLVEELTAVGIQEIMVTEYFSPQSQISRLVLIAEDPLAETVRNIVHRIGTTGEPGDHSIFVEEYDPSLPNQIPLGAMTSSLEESRIKQLISVLFRGTNQKLSAVFLFITLSIIAVAVLSYIQLGTFRQNVYRSADVIQRVRGAVIQIQNSMLEEMLAVEQLHRGDVRSGLMNIREAQRRDQEATLFLRTIASTNSTELDSLTILHTRFQELVGNMVIILDRLEHRNVESTRSDVIVLTQSHNLVMTSLHTLHLATMTQLASLEQRVNMLFTEQRIQSDGVLQRIRLLLLGVALLVVVITVLLWIFAEKKVTRPIMQIFQESKNIDIGKI